MEHHKRQHFKTNYLENKRVNKIEIHTVFKQIEDKIKTDISLLIKTYIQIQYYEKVNYYFPFRQLFFWNYDRE